MCLSLYKISRIVNVKVPSNYCLSWFLVEWINNMWKRYFFQIWEAQNVLYLPFIYKFCHYLTVLTWNSIYPVLTSLFSFLFLNIYLCINLWNFYAFFPHEGCWQKKIVKRKSVVNFFLYIGNNIYIINAECINTNIVPFGFNDRYSWST